MSTRAITGPVAATPMRASMPTQMAGAAGANSIYAGQGAGTVGGVADGFSQFVQAGGSLFGGSPQAGGDSGGGSQGSGSIPQALPFKSPILDKAKQKAEAPTDKSAEKPKESSRSVVFEDEGGGGGDYSE